MPHQERRKGPDIWIWTARSSAVVGWLFFIGAIVVSYFAAPEQSYGLTRYHQIPVRENWAQPFTQYLYVILWFSALMSFISIAINHYRSKRRTDSHYFNALLLLLASIAWTLYIVSDIYL